MLAHRLSAIVVPQIKSGVAARIPAIVGMMLGLFIVGFVGFSQLDAVHNAAHDTRHSNAFPCH